MNFKKNWKRFWTLSRAREGFTLVELIVVIAIMAILAGVAVPAYTGYIKKAEKASDLQLLGAVNTAFGAAVMDRDQKSATELANGSVSFDIANMKPSDYQEQFAIYFAGNDGAEFKVIKSLVLQGGVFVDPMTVSEVTLSYAGGTIIVSSDVLAAMDGSTFLNAETLGGSAGLLDKVDLVTGIAAGMAGSLEAVFNDAAFKACAMEALGCTTPEEYIAKQETILAALMEKNPGMSRADAEATLGANAAVLYASKHATAFTDTQISELFSTTGVDSIKSNLKTDGKTAEGMAQAALIYGMYTSYAHSEKYGSADKRANTENPVTVLNALEKDEDFKTYINSPQGKADMDAYLGALGMINESADSNPTAVEHLMVNGFNNSELKDLVAGVTGK